MPPHFVIQKRLPTTFHSHPNDHYYSFFITVHTKIMSSYLDTSYTSYQDYLHQRSRLPVTTSQYYQPRREYRQDIIVNRAPGNQIESKIEYFPVQRKEVEYKDNTIIQKVPKRKKMVEYVEHKEIEMVPKEVTKIDYYAVQHIKQYIKEVIPEVKIETIKVPKTIKNIEHIPIEKQIILYPSHLTDMEQIKRQANEILSKQGVTIKENAQYRPIQHRESTIVTKQPLLESTTFRRISPQRSYIRSSPERYYLRSSPERYLNSSINHNKIPKYSRYPLYNKDKYNFLRHDYPFNDSKDLSFSVTKALEPTSDYTFAQKDQYRYDLAMHNSLKRTSQI